MAARVIPSDTQYGYIYVTTNLVDGACYLGQHKGAFNPKYLGSGKILKHAISKYGRDNFIVSEIISSETHELLDSFERMGIAFLRTMKCVPRVYNLASGGSGVCYVTITDEARRKMSQSHKGRKLPKITCERMAKARLGRNNPFFGRKHSEASKAKFRATMAAKRDGKEINIIRAASS